MRRFGAYVQKLVGAEVRPGEGHLVFVFFTNLLLLLTAYYVLKVVREPLILLHGGAVSRSYARGLQALLLIALVPAYSILANRIEPGRLVNVINGIFLVSLVAFVALGALHIPIGFAFFVWLGIFSTMAIAQFWSLANDLLTEPEGKRLFPLVATGGTLGGIVGSQIAARSLGALHVYALMGIAAALLLICMTLTQYSRRAAVAHRALHPHIEREPERDARGGFSLLLKDRYLLLIAGSVLLLNLVNTTGDFILAEMVNERAKLLTAGLADANHARELYIGQFYGDFQTAITVLTALIQVLLVARIFRKIGVGSALYLLPTFVVAGYGVAGLVPILGLVVLIKVGENSTDYSLQNTIQQTLFLPTSRDAKYKAKTAIDTFVVRVGDLASASIVFLGAQADLGARGFSVLNALLGVSWLWVVAQISRRHRRLAASPEAQTAALWAQSPSSAE